MSAPCARLIKRPLRVFLVFAVLLVAAYGLYTQLPTSFLPEEDQGVLMTQITPAGRRQRRPDASRRRQVRDYFLTQEKDAVESVFMTSASASAAPAKTRPWGSSG